MDVSNTAQRDMHTLGCVAVGTISGNTLLPEVCYYSKDKLRSTVYQYTVLFLYDILSFYWRETVLPFTSKYLFSEAPNIFFFCLLKGLREGPMQTTINSIILNMNVRIRH